MAPPGKPLWVGLLFHLDPDWHIYWQNPGDSGEPPKIQWRLPAGLVAGGIHWPTPIRLGSGTVADYGYEGQVLLMTPLESSGKAGAPSNPHIEADVRYIVCRELCVPATAHLKLTTPQGRDFAPWRALFQQTRQQLPKPLPRGWKISVESNNTQFVISVWGATGIKGASFFPLEPNRVENSTAQDFASNRRGFRLTVKKSDQLLKPISTLRGLLVLNSGSAYEVAAPVVSR